MKKLLLISYLTASFLINNICRAQIPNEGYHHSFVEPDDTATNEVIFTDGNTELESRKNYFTTNSNVYKGFTFPLYFMRIALPDSGNIYAPISKPGIKIRVPISNDSLIADAVNFILSSGQNKIGGSIFPLVLPHSLAGNIKPIMPIAVEAPTAATTNERGINVVKTERTHFTNKPIVMLPHENPLYTT